MRIPLKNYLVRNLRRGSVGIIAHTYFVKILTPALTYVGAGVDFVFYLLPLFPVVVHIHRVVSVIGFMAHKLFGTEPNRNLCFSLLGSR